MKLFFALNPPRIFCVILFYFFFFSVSTNFCKYNFARFMFPDLRRLYPVLDRYLPVPKITKQLYHGVVLSIRLYPFLKIEPLIMSRDTVKPTTRRAYCQDSNQPAHPRSLISVFAGRMKNLWFLSQP